MTYLRISKKESPCLQQDSALIQGQPHSWRGGKGMDLPCMLPHEIHLLNAVHTDMPEGEGKLLQRAHHRLLPMPRKGLLSGLCSLSKCRLMSHDSGFSYTLCWIKHTVLLKSKETFCKLKLLLSHHPLNKQSKTDALDFNTFHILTIIPKKGDRKLPDVNHVVEQTSDRANQRTLGLRQICNTQQFIFSHANETFCSEQEA